MWVLCLLLLLPPFWKGEGVRTHLYFVPTPLLEQLLLWAEMDPYQLLLYTRPPSAAAAAASEQHHAQHEHHHHQHHCLHHAEPQAATVGLTLPVLRIPLKVRECVSGYCCTVSQSVTANLTRTFIIHPYITYDTMQEITALTPVLHAEPLGLVLDLHVGGCCIRRIGLCRSSGLYDTDRHQHTHTPIYAHTQSLTRSLAPLQIHTHKHTHNPHTAGGRRGALPVLRLEHAGTDALGQGLRGPQAAAAAAAGTAAVGSLSGPTRAGPGAADRSGEESVKGALPPLSDGGLA